MTDNITMTPVTPQDPNPPRHRLVPRTIPGRIALVAAVLVALVIVLGALGSKSTPAATTAPAQPAATAPAQPVTAPASPADASAVLTADGYTPVLTESQADIASSFGEAAPYVASAAGGIDSSGNEEVAVVVSDEGVSLMGGPPAVVSGLEADIPGSTVTVTAQGPAYVIRVSGPESAFGSAS